MIRYLRVKKRKVSNCVNHYLVFREKNKRLDGRFENKAKEKYIPKKQNLLILGENAAGKTKEFNKIKKKIDKIYPKNDILIFEGKESLSDWLNKNLKDDDIGLIFKDLTEEEKIKVEKEAKKQYIKLQILKEKAKNNILLIDDIDMITGKKLEIMKDLVRVSKVIIATAKSEQTIDKTILRTLQNKKYNAIKLTTRVSFDATYYLFAAMIVAMLLTGNYELSIIVMMGRYLLKEKK